MSNSKIPVLILITLLFLALSCAAPVNLTPQKPDSTIVIRPAGEGLILGKSNAPAKIEVFEDFQCPACLNFSKKIEPLVLKELVDTGKAYYVFRHLPFLDSGTPTGESQQAANASMCASEQGKFWEYKTTIFDHWVGENVGAYNDQNLAAFAENLNLNMEAFNTCFTENRYKSLIEADIKDSKGMGVQGTPSVFVNGKMLTPGYVPSFEDIQNAVAAAQP